jgi:hypothetical protein
VATSWKVADGITLLAQLSSINPINQFIRLFALLEDQSFTCLVPSLNTSIKA